MLFSSGKDPHKGRQRSDTKRWRGPAVILAADGPIRYFIGYRNRALLDAADNLGDSSEGEAATADVAGICEQRKCFDVKEGEPVPEEEAQVDPDAATWCNQRAASESLDVWAQTFGTYQTHAPATSWVAVQVAVTLAASLGVCPVRHLIWVRPFCLTSLLKRRFMPELRATVYQLLVTCPRCVGDNCCRFRRLRGRSPPLIFETSRQTACDSWGIWDADARCSRNTLRWKSSG